MSVAHSGVSFNHSCLKVPVDPTSKRPSPHYERVFSCKLSDGVRESECRKRRETSLISSSNSSVENYKSVESYLQFYEAIPDYSELHHLSDEEFYSRLKSLKITQRRFCSGTSEVNDDEATDRPSSNSSIGFRHKYNPRDVYGKSASPKKRHDSRVSSGYSYSSSGQPERAASGYGKKVKNHWSRVKLSDDKPAPSKINTVSDSENISDLGLEDKALAGGCLCKGALYGKNCHGDDAGGYIDDGCTSVRGFSCRKSRSTPSSPGWKPKYCGCIPDHSECFLDGQSGDSMHHHIHCEDVEELKKRNSPKKQKKFFTRPVPLLSRIPLYDKIMAEQEERRRVNHNRYSRELRALVQPFSFTKREEQEKQKMRMACSNPELNVSPKRSQVTFKAKPIPKNLFSNYAYERMREEDFYRALKKRIRAEELLRSSSLPPSMAEREKYRSKSLDFLDNKYSKEERTKVRGHKRVCDLFRRETDEKNRSGKSQKRRGKPFWLNKKTSNSVTDSSTEVSPYESVSEPERRHHKRPHSAISVNRSNLASVLRMQTIRKRMEKEMQDNLEENRLKQQAKFKERLIRMTPAWRALNYSTEEDLALRVAARREEERLKKKRYEKLMGSIYGRVHEMPPLFQRQSSNTKQTKRVCDQKETSPKDYKYFNGSKTGKDAGVRRKTLTITPSPTRYENFSRTHKSSESSGSHEKSDGSKIGESDNETGSREDEIEDYIQRETDELGRTMDAGGEPKSRVPATMFVDEYWRKLEQDEDECRRLGRYSWGKPHGKE